MGASWAQEWGLGFGVWVWGFGVWGFWGLGLGFLGLGFLGLGFRLGGGFLTEIPKRLQYRGRNNSNKAFGAHSA